MSTAVPRGSRGVLSMLLFLSVLVLCLALFCFLLPGEPLTDYRYAAEDSTPPGISGQPDWQDNSAGHSLRLPPDADAVLLEGTLAPGQILLIPSFFGTVVPSDVQAETRLSGSAYFLLTQPGSYTLRIYLPFQKNLHPRILNPEHQQRLTLLMRSLWISGAVLLLLCLFPGPGKVTMLITGTYLLLSSVPPETALPGWMLTGKLLLLGMCPLAALIAFKRRYRMDNDRTDHLISFTMSFSICLIYYHFDAFNHWLVMFGAGLQTANLILLGFLVRQKRHSYAPAAFGALAATLTAFLGLWLSLTLEISGTVWLMAALVSMAVYLLLLRLPAPAPRTQYTHWFPQDCRDLRFANFEHRLKKMGFDSETIDRIQHKCNTSSRHLQHVAEYTRAICTAMGFSAGMTEQISSAALLHDIGKLEIPDAILFDSGKLTAEAFARLQSHNELGYALLTQRDSDFFRLAAEIALYHHERIDGTGYLKRKGEEIPLPARIVAVADVFDALTAPRVYKQPWDFDAAFSHITENRGILFDGAVVDDFMKSKAAIRQIYDSFYTPMT